MTDEADYWHVEPEWRGETVAILASGPSLTQEQVDLCMGRVRVVAINSSVQLAPHADILYFCDRRWFNWNKEDVLSFRGARVTLDNVQLKNEIDGLRCVKNVANQGYADKNWQVCTGRNSGYQAINMVGHLGVARIILLGYDMRVAPDPSDPRGYRTHFHGGHPTETRPEHFSDTMLPQFQHLPGPLATRGIGVVNCTPGSALTCWPMRDLEEVLQDESCLPNTRAAALQARGVCRGP